MNGKGSPLWWGAFFNLFGYICGRDAEQRAAGGDGTDAGGSVKIYAQIYLQAPAE